MRRSVLLLLALAVGLTGCGRPSEPARAPSEPAGDGPTGTLFLRHVRQSKLTVVDLAARRAESVVLPELALGGDPPFHLVQTGGKLVVWGTAGRGAAALARDLDLNRPAQNLGDSWYFVPSATEGRVWLALLDPESPETVRDLKAVREVTVDGRITVPDTGRPPCRGPTVLAAVEDGLLCQDRDGLRVWDPVTGEVVMRLPGPFPADTHGNLVAWCAQACPRLHVTDVGTGDEVVVSPDASYVFEETYDGAFSPDGSLLAVPVLAGSDRHRRVALIDVAEGTAAVIEGSKLARDYLAITWSRSGEWLFFTAEGGGIMAYRPGSAGALLIPLRVRGRFLDIAAG